MQLRPQLAVLAFCPRPGGHFAVGKICVFSNLDPCPWHHPVVSVEVVKYCDVFSVNVQLIEDERAANPAICSHLTHQRKMCGLFDIGLNSGTSCFL